MPPEETNRLLSALSAESRDYLISRSKFVPLPIKTMLYRPEETPQFAYFMTSGMASIVTSMQDGATAEVGVVGSEGFIGALHVLGPAKVSTNSFVQLEGSGYKIPFTELRQAFRAKDDIRDLVLEYIQEQAVTTSQIAGCNRLHEAEERLARWLLMAQDRTHSDVLHFTQEFLAMMLGARRTTVSLIAGALQNAGLVQYERGNVRILDRANLEAAACDCYSIIRQLNLNLYRHATGPESSDGDSPPPPRTSGA